VGAAQQFKVGLGAGGAGWGACLLCFSIPYFFLSFFLFPLFHSFFELLFYVLFHVVLGSFLPFFFLSLPFLLLGFFFLIFL
jgi:hypothetical protein